MQSIFKSVESDRFRAGPRIIWLEPVKSCSLRHKLGRAPNSSSNCRASARLGRAACTCEVMVGTGGGFGAEERGSVGRAIYYSAFGQ